MDTRVCRSPIILGKYESHSAEHDQIEVSPLLRGCCSLAKYFLNISD